jgi:hypothetical protein
LAAHLACRQAGFTVRHFERQHEPGPAGAGIVRWSNGVKILQAFAGRLEQIGCTPDRLVVRSNQDEILSEIPFSDLNRRLGVGLCDEPNRSASSPAGGAGPERSGHGRELRPRRADHRRAVACMADRPRAAADLVVGADGIHSAVRRAVVGEVTPRYAGFATWVGIIDNGGLIAGQTANRLFGRWPTLRFAALTANRMYYNFASASEQRIPKPADGGFDTLTVIARQLWRPAFNCHERNQLLGFRAANPKRLQKRLYCVNVSMLNCPSSRTATITQFEISAIAFFFKILAALPIVGLLLCFKHIFCFARMRAPSRSEKTKPRSICGRGYVGCDLCLSVCKHLP